MTAGESRPGAGSAASGLVPDLTIVLELPPGEGLKRRARSGDRLAAEPTEFHERVRAGLPAQSHAGPHRYLVVDAASRVGGR